MMFLVKNHYNEVGDRVMDRSMVCIQCGNQFIIKTHELEKLKARGFDYPKRCIDCRKHKTRNAGNSSEDGDYKRKRKQSREEEEFFGE